jgi:hypothetical protein
MKRVVLIPTGSMEHAALAPALQRLFSMNAGSQTEDIVFEIEPPERHLDSFTSEDVSRIPPPGPIQRNEDKLAARLVAAVDTSNPPDFACVVEDLELKNDHQLDLVVGIFWAAVQRHLNGHPWSSQHRRQTVEERLRERCSFHLFRPMTEAYFFGEPAALIRARAALVPQLSPSGDLEQFETTDAVYLALPPDNRPKNQRRIKDHPERARHPKSYLHYLCDPTLKDKQKRYRETEDGATALRQLDWERVLEAPPHCPFLHAFLDDLAEALNRPFPFLKSERAHPLLRFPGGRDRLLRNIF